MGIRQTSSIKLIRRSASSIVISPAPAKAIPVGAEAKKLTSAQRMRLEQAAGELEVGDVTYRAIKPFVPLSPEGMEGLLPAMERRWASLMVHGKLHNPKSYAMTYAEFKTPEGVRKLRITPHLGPRGGLGERNDPDNGKSSSWLDCPYFEVQILSDRGIEVSGYIAQDVGKSTYTDSATGGPMKPSFDTELLGRYLASLRSLGES
jgi:hypothetical protein